MCPQRRRRHGVCLCVQAVARVSACAQLLYYNLKLYGTATGRRKTLHVSIHHRFNAPVKALCYSVLAPATLYRTPMTPADQHNSRTLPAHLSSWVSWERTSGSPRFRCVSRVFSAGRERGSSTDGITTDFERLAACCVMAMFAGDSTVRGDVTPERHRLARATMKRRGISRQPMPFESLTGGPCNTHYLSRRSTASKTVIVIAQPGVSQRARAAPPRQRARIPSSA